MPFITVKRKEAREKPYIATIKIDSIQPKATLEVQLQLRADIAPKECSVLRAVLNEGRRYLCFGTSGIKIGPHLTSTLEQPQASANAVSPEVLWIKVNDDGSNEFGISDEGTEENWSGDTGYCGRIVNWADLKELLSVPFVSAFRYSLAVYSARFPTEIAANCESDEKP